MTLPIITVAVGHEQDVVTARRRARQIARLLKFCDQDGARIGTAVSEVARNAHANGGGGKVDFLIDTAEPQSLTIEVSAHRRCDADGGSAASGSYPAELGIIGARRLMDEVQTTSLPGRGTTIILRKYLPAAARHIASQGLAALAGQLAQEPQDPYDEIRNQNQELLSTLEDLRQREEDLSRMNHELEDTNRGVVALYAELDQRAEQLRNADRMKSRFLSHMSHEFRTPLNAILGLTRLLLKREAVGQNPEVAREVSFIQQTTLSLTEMVDDLLDLSKAESGKLTVQAAEFDVSTLFSTLRAMLRPLAVNSAVELIFEDPVGIPSILNDENKISQILRNLLSNALKFTERGEVRTGIRYLPAEDLLVFSVSDTGIGIAPEYHARIFEEFAQIDNPLQTKTKGTGLGLALCKKLAELLGGSIRVESELGAGSRFTVVIPRVFAAAAGELESGQAGNIVLIDDEEVSRYLLRQLLAGSFKVVEAATGNEGITQVTKLRPHLVLLDLNMPDMSGFEVLERLKSAAETRDIPVVVVTGQDLNSEVREQLAAHTAAVLPKHMLAEVEALSIDFGPPLTVSPRYAGDRASV
jgi:signal transduction histidine kinase/CheY-like chemotaxis protein